MPLKVKKVKAGYKVCDDKGKCLSNKPLSKKQATKQELAVRLSTLRKEGKIPPQKGKGKISDAVGKELLKTGSEAFVKGFKFMKDAEKTPLTAAKKAEYDAMIQKYKQQKGKGAVMNRVGSDIAKVGKAGVKAVGTAIADVAASGINRGLDWLKKELTRPLTQAEKDAALKKLKGGNFFEDALRLTNPAFDMAMRARDKVIKGNGSGYNQSSYAVLRNQTINL